jgi:methyl coenzyme M reductase beta subunit
MPYTVLDAMKDEVELLREQAKVEEKEGRIIAVSILRQIAMSHQRIINRVEKGLDYSLEIVDGEIKRVSKQSNRKTLEEEYPALKNAAEQYNLVKDLVDSTPD